MGVIDSKFKSITVFFTLKDVQNDPHFFRLPGEIASIDEIKDVIMEKYQTKTGSLEGQLDRQRLVLCWSPERIDKNAEILHREALEYAKNRQFDKAIEKWGRAHSINDSDVDYLYKLGLLYFEMKKYGESIKYLEKAEKICPIHFKIQLLLGINWIKLKQFENAKQYILSSNRLNRSNVLTYLNLGAIYSIQKDYKKAIEVLNTTIQLAPKESRAYLGLAKIYTMMNDIEMANSYFKKVIELAPGTKLADYAKKSMVLSHKEQINEDTSNNGKELLAKGIQFYLSGDYLVSSQQYKEYLKSHPSDDYTWYLLGEIKLRTGELDEAADCLKRAIRLNSKRGLYYKSLGVVLNYAGKSKEVLEVLNKAVELGKNDILCQTLLGINLFRERKIEEAIHQFKLTLGKFSNNPLAMYHLALAYLQTDRGEQAKNLINKMLAFEQFIPLKIQAKKLNEEMRN